MSASNRPCIETILHIVLKFKFS